MPCSKSSSWGARGGNWHATMDTNYLGRLWFCRIAYTPCVCDTCHTNAGRLMNQRRPFDEPTPAVWWTNASRLMNQRQPFDEPTPAVWWTNASRLVNQLKSCSDQRQPYSERTSAVWWTNASRLVNGRQPCDEPTPAVWWTDVSRLLLNEPMIAV